MSLGVYTVPGLPGIVGPHNVPIWTIEFANPTLDIPGSFPLIDLTLDDPTPITVSAGTNDLMTWFAPPEIVDQLQISTSRWDHVLRLCHPNGESYPITREQKEGYIDADPNGTGTFHHYYLFKANSAARPDLPWYVEDLSTDPVQRIGPTGSNLRPTNYELTVWYHLPAPTGLTGSLSVGHRQVEVVWSKTGASLEGAFVVERQLTDSNGPTAWIPVRTLPFAADASFGDGVFFLEADGLYHFRDHIPDPTVGKVRAYRVRYQYGTPADYSEWSNVVTIAGWADTDGDGMPDAWEIAHFGSLDQDENGNKDGDTITNQGGQVVPYTNLAEFLGHTNPNALPAGAAGSTLIVYTPLQ